VDEVGFDVIRQFAHFLGEILAHLIDRVGDLRKDFSFRRHDYPHLALSAITLRRRSLMENRASALTQTIINTM
jgi:hypothetical protein